ncbi:MAG: MMPL family transporter [Myxococcaceae bacterium]|nr:MMPL family transporter [Myxococcaceae bacterium]MCA3015404.1 MMPL family transporter [Myxococcaceae bacterium]
MSPDSRTGHLLTRLATFSFQRPAVVFLVLLAIGGAFALIASRLGFRGDFIELLPDSTREVQDLKVVQELAGGGGYFVVRVRGSTTEGRRAYAAALATRLEAERALVSYVEYRFDAAFFKRRALWLLPAPTLGALADDVDARITWEKQRALPGFVDLLDEAPPPTLEELERTYGSRGRQGEYLEGRTAPELYLFVKPTRQAGDLDFNRQILAKVTEVTRSLSAAHPGLEADFTGAYVARVEEDDVMREDLGRAGLVSSVLALTIILLSTRRLTALLVVALPVALGISATFAFAYFTIGHLNPVTGFLGAILVGLGLEYGTHLAMRYWEERRLDEVLPALRTTVLSTFPGAITSALTNSAAFLVLLASRFDAFKQFGGIAGFGVMATVLSAYVMAPAILRLAEAVRPFKARPVALDGDGRPATGPRVPTGVLVALVVAITAVAAVSATFAPKASFEKDLKRLKGKSPATELDEAINEQLGVIMTPAIIAVRSLDEAARLAATARAFKAEKGTTSAISEVATLNDFFPPPAEVEARRAGIERLRAVLGRVPEAIRTGQDRARFEALAEMLDASPWGPDEVPLELRRRFQPNRGEGTFVLIFPALTGYNADALDRWAADLDEVTARGRSSGLDPRVLDTNRIASRIFTIVREDGPFIMLGASVVVFVMILVSLRSLRRAALVTVPLYVGITCIFGAMQLFDVKLNFLNVVVLPNLLTIAVDNSVHLYHRYLEEGRGSIGHALRHTGFASLVATCSNAAGYAALFVARHEGLRSIAWLAVLGVACSFLGTTVLFPALLELVERLTLKPSAPEATGK